ncbi:uncharacterized protein LOC130745068 [Lotus japonicus]|uniref:uncharacterized protein LOC130745068 n=1 Tax=Lotus japonicus TaxID=34305 RepID=UPI00258DBC33|nr:uncharacterized protein LOC130745068 [Lotus japonicus]
MFSLQPQLPRWWWLLSRRCHMGCGWLHHRAVFQLLGLLNRSFSSASNESSAARPPPPPPPPQALFIPTRSTSNPTFSRSYLNCTTIMVLLVTLEKLPSRRGECCLCFLQQLSFMNSQCQYDHHI